MGTQSKTSKLGFTIIEVMLFFGVTGALMVGILGSAMVGINSQRYNDAVNSFAAIVQQEFTNATNVVNTNSVDSVCSGSSDDSARPRGISQCVILGRLMTIEPNGDILRSNLVGKEPSGEISATDSELDVVLSYEPKIDTQSQESGQMNWETKIEKNSSPGGSNVSFLIIRSPRSGNLYSYVLHSSSSVIASNPALEGALENLAASSSNPQNAKDQYMCIDRADWVVSPARVVKIAPYASGPSGVSTIEESGTICN